MEIKLKNEFVHPNIFIKDTSLEAHKANRIIIISKALDKINLPSKNNFNPYKCSEKMSYVILPKIPLQRQDIQSNNSSNLNLLKQTEIISNVEIKNEEYPQFDICSQLEESKQNESICSNKFEEAHQNCVDKKSHLGGYQQTTLKSNGFPYNNEKESISFHKNTQATSLFSCFNKINKSSVSSTRRDSMNFRYQPKEKLVAKSLPPSQFVEYKLTKVAQCKFKYQTNNTTQTPILLQCTTVNNLGNVKYKQNPLFNCRYCPSTFESKSNLLIHLRIHRGEKPFECEICKKAYTQKIDLMRHKKIHTGEKNFICEICNASFIQKSNLRTHIDVHNDVRRFECSVCFKKFTRKLHLQQHMAVHSLDKPFKCSICPQKFSYASTLKTHLNIHIEAKPFGCRLCQKKYKTPKSFSSHIRIHKEADDLVECYCTLCDVTLPHKMLIVHVKMQHPKQMVNGRLSISSNLTKAFVTSTCNLTSEVKKSGMENSDVLNFIDMSNASSYDSNPLNQVVKEENIDKFDQEFLSSIIKEEKEEEEEEKVTFLNDGCLQDSNTKKFLQVSLHDPLCL